MYVYSLIKQLIELVGEFIDGKDEKVSLKSFAHWLVKRTDSEIEVQEYPITGHNMEAELAAHIGRMNRYANSYIKSALAHSPFVTEMDFAFTAILQKSGQIGKTELIRQMVYDKSSGMEVIKRLISNGLIAQLPNPKDRRGKLLQLTKKGKNSIEEAYSNAGKAATVVSSCLTNEEKTSLLVTFKKLDRFHQKIYLEEEKDLNKILERATL
ncbi:MAG: winged helix DNA-binding protein [Saonia sp.]